ncbi:MAG: hypothetical protein FD180_1985 [Planctomycetota bacterium]|nr:MAG: hypothetical protein FD180_1985 [Planctomycetota bacterium]
MNRSVAIHAVLVVALGAVFTFFFIQNTRLRTDLDAARAEKPAPAVAAAPGLDPALLKERQRGDELEKKVGDLEIALAAAKLDDGKKKKKKDPDAAAKDPDKEKEDAANARMMEIMKKLGKVLPLGVDITEAAAKELGLEPGQIAAVNLAMKDEAKRLSESLQAFYAENFNAQEEGLYEKPGNELMRLMLGKVMGEVMELSKLPPEKAMGIHTGETSLEELLGADKVSSKLAATVHAERLKTYEALASSLTPEQLALFRDTYWREGSIYYPGQEHYEFGMAPKDMKK